MNPSKQKGMVLLVSLILLLMLTLIAITASNQATLQLRISSNSEQRTQAFQAAEAGISNWVGTYFNIPLKDLHKIYKINISPLDKVTSITVGEGTKSQLNETFSTVGACPNGSSINGAVREMYCFNIQAEGLSACDDNNECVKSVHRQGGIRVGNIQQ